MTQQAAKNPSLNQNAKKLTDLRRSQGREYRDKFLLCLVVTGGSGPGLQTPSLDLVGKLEHEHADNVSHVPKIRDK